MEIDDVVVRGHGDRELRCRLWSDGDVRRAAVAGADHALLREDRLDPRPIAKAVRAVAAFVDRL